MKLPDFDHSKMAWDSWNAFHVKHDYRFVQFDTGELVVCAGSWRPEYRRVYQNLHIRIVATDDDACPRLYAPGDKPIPWSHLDHKGHQVLLLDFDHKRAVGLRPYLTKDNASVPERFTRGGVVAWYAGPNALPVGSPITRHYPQPLTTARRAHVNELMDSCKVWWEMQSPEARSELGRTGGVAPPVLECVDVPFRMIPVERRAAIALRGFNMTAKETHPWLTF